MNVLSANAVQRPSALLREQVAAQLRDAIINLQLTPGQSLIERELCAATTVSRATVREALRQLESEGLVSSGAHGTTVAMVSDAEAREIYEMRAILEGSAGRLFAERATESDHRALRTALDALEHAADDTGAMLLAKTKFYSVLTHGAKNSQLEGMLTSLTHRAALVRSRSLSRPGRWKQSLAEMRAICAAAVEGNAEQAARLCQEHVNKAATAFEPPK